MAQKTNDTEHKVKTIDERRKTTREAVVDDILAIAREMMQADGVAAVSFNGIARRLGIKPPSLYTYFNSKHAIYDALFRMGYETFQAQLQQHADRDNGAESFFRSLFVAYMQFGLQNPDLFQLMFQRPVPGFVPSEASLAVSFGALEQMRSELQMMVENSSITSDMPIEETGDLIIALMHGLTALQLANNPESPIGEGRFGILIDNAVKLLMQAWEKET